MTTATTNPRRRRIVVPQRMVQGGLAAKFETDPYDVPLHGLLTEQDYTDSITRVNDRLKKARPNKIDALLLGAGALLVPLALWGMRHKRQTTIRHRQLKKAINEFHDAHPTLLMRWNNRGHAEHILTIELRPPPQPVEARPAADSGAVTNTSAAMDQEDVPMAVAEPHQML